MAYRSDNIHPMQPPATVTLFVSTNVILAHTDNAVGVAHTQTTQSHTLDIHHNSSRCHYPHRPLPQPGVLLRLLARAHSATLHSSLPDTTSAGYDKRAEGRRDREVLTSAGARGPHVRERSSHVTDFLRCGGFVASRFWLPRFVIRVPAWPRRRWSRR